MKVKTLERYIDSTEQLVTEIFVRDIKKSVDFCRQLRFGTNLPEQDQA